MSISETLDLLAGGDLVKRTRLRTLLVDAAKHDLLTVRYEDGTEVEPGSVGAHYNMGTHILSGDLGALLRRKRWSVTYDAEASRVPDAKVNELLAAPEPTPDTAPASASVNEPEPASAAGTVVTNHQQRVHSLADAIVEAQRHTAAPHDWQSVWPELRKLALSEFSCFTGEIRGKDGALGYTNHKSELNYFTPAALRARLYRLRLRASVHQRTLAHAKSR